MTCNGLNVYVLSPSVVAPQAPLSMGFSRQEDWSGLPLPPPEDLVSLLSLALAGGFFTTSTSWEATTSTA